MHLSDRKPESHFPESFKKILGYFLSPNLSSSYRNPPQKPKKREKSTFSPLTRSKFSPNSVQSPTLEKAIPPEVDPLRFSPPLLQFKLRRTSTQAFSNQCCQHLYGCRGTNHHRPQFHPSPTIHTTTNILSKNPLDQLSPQHPPALLTLLLFRQSQSLWIRHLLLFVHR